MKNHRPASIQIKLTKERYTEERDVLARKLKRRQAVSSHRTARVLNRQEQVLCLAVSAARGTPDGYTNGRGANMAAHLVPVFLIGGRDPAGQWNFVVGRR